MYQCTRCGGPADVITGCPYCGQPAPPLAAELERLNRDIAEMSAHDLAMQKERADLSAKMQAALHQRALLHSAQRQRVRRPPRQRRAARRVATLLPSQVRAARRTDRAKRARTPAGPGGAAPPRTLPAAPPTGLRAEASSRSVQNVLLALGALLLGVAALVFTDTALDSVGRAAILVVVCAAVLMVPPFVARYRLTSTAEAVTTVGLVLVPLAGHAFWQIDAVRAALRVSATGYAGLVCLALAGIAAGYHWSTRLTAPRYAVLLALQPALPLLAYEWIAGAAGWALVFTGVAAADVLVGRALDRRRAALPSVGWLREVAWILHGVAVGAALVYATVALGTADVLPAAVRASATVLLAAGVGLAGALSLRRSPLPDVAGAVMTLAVIGSAARVAVMALPGRALVLVAGAVAVTAVGVRILPSEARRGPQLAASGALAAVGTVVAAASLRAAAAPVLAVLPPWHADLSRYGERLADSVGAAGWQVAVSALLLTAAAGLVVPAALRREATVAAAALTAAAVPASFALGWAATPWALLAAAVALGVTGFAAPTARSAQAHVLAAFLVGSTAAASSLAQPALTAGVLAALTVVGALLGTAPRYVTGGPYADITAAAALGGAAAALPGAIATTTATALPHAGPVPVLVTSSLGVSVALGYAAITEVALRRPVPPVALGSTLGAVAVAVAAFAADAAMTADRLVATLLLLGAMVLWLAPSIDAGSRARQWIDGADAAAAVITAGSVAALTRAAALLAPGTALAAAALLVLAMALVVRTLPQQWRTGFTIGCALAGGVAAAIAGYAALLGGLRVFIAASPIWATDLTAWPSAVAVARGHGWQTPVALLLLAAASAVVMPLRARAVLVPACVALAVTGAPAALGLPWWSPTVLGLTVATILGLGAVSTEEPRTGIARASAAAALTAYAVGGSLVAPWATASALAGVATASILVAVAARLGVGARLPAQTDSVTTPTASVGVYASPVHLVPIGGAAVTTALLALPGALAAAAASLDRSTGTVLGAGLAAASLGLALVALVHRQAADYLSYAAVGTAVSTTGIALIALLVGQPYGVYAAAAALLGVLADSVRANAAEPAGRVGRPPHPGGRLFRVTSFVRPRRIGRTLPPRLDSSGVLTPGLLATAGVPTLLALASIAPALAAVLGEPYRALAHAWKGPDAAGVTWTGTAGGASVVAALVLTLAAGLAAVGFGERAETRLTRDELLGQVIPVMIPGVAVTLLIAPAGLGLAWPAGTTAALVVFTISMLGVALSAPPPDTAAARPLRVTRWVVLAIGLAAGGAGLAGSLATRSMTLATLTGAVGVGVTAALGGRTTLARVLGWAFASASAHSLAYATGLAIGLPAYWSAFGVMAVAALALVTATTMRRLRRPEARGEAPALEWSGYAGGLLALALAGGSLPHLAGLLAAWGAVLGIAAVRPGRSVAQRQILLWAAALFEIAAWWLIMQISDVGLIEAYTLPFAGFALLVGVIELRHQPELSSWAAYGPALVAAFVPTLGIVLVTETAAPRRILLLLGAVAVLIAGSVARQRAPVVVGSAVTTITALHELIAVSDWLIFIPIGVLLVVLGATYEKRRRDVQRLRGALGRMR